MKFLSNAHLDLLSFLLGILTGTIFWWVITAFRKTFPSIREVLDRRTEKARQKSLSVFESNFRQNMMRKTQQSHLTADFFSLEEVLVPPLLIAPPVALADPHSLGSESLSSQFLPYLPEYPEIFQNYPISHLSLAQALQNGASIAVIGKSGCGKTITLADLAIKVLNNSPEAQPFSNHIPLFIHFADLDLPAEGEMDACEILSRAIGNLLPLRLQSQAPKFTESLIHEKRLLLLLDGLDELSPAQLHRATQFIKLIKKLSAGIPIAVSASRSYLDGLIGLGFFPLAVAAWNSTIRTDFLSKWAFLWEKEIQTSLSVESSTRSRFLLNSWLEDESMDLSPLELTLLVWGAFSGHLEGSGPIFALEAYLQEYAGGVSHKAMEFLGTVFLQQGTALLKLNHLENELNRFNPLPPSKDNSLSNPSKTRAHDKVEKVSNAERILNILLDQGLLIQHSNGIVRFCNPLLGSYLASYVITLSEGDLTTEATCSPIFSDYVKFWLAQNKTSDWVLNAAEPQMDIPFYNDFFLVCSGLQATPQEASWREVALRSLVSLLFSPAEAPALRFRALAASIQSKDPSLPVLFQKMTINSEPLLRQFGAFGIGAIQNQKSLEVLLDLLPDPNEAVRVTACLALGVLGTQERLLIDIFENGDEYLRRAAAETFAMAGSRGQDVLLAALKSEDILTRRAAVFGLALTRAPWAALHLERTSIEDGQWVVRNAAGQALEEINKAVASIPTPLEDPNQSSWLIKFASEHGLGISPVEFPLELLLQVLKEGNPEEQLAAARVLCQVQDESISHEYYRNMFQGTGALQAASSYFAWLQEVSGAEMPSPAKFGYR